MDDLHVGFLVPNGVENFGEDEDGCISFFWHHSVGYTFFYLPGDFDARASCVRKRIEERESDKKLEEK